MNASIATNQTILVERNATLGGRTMLMNRYFPKMCHPTAVLPRDAGLDGQLIRTEKLERLAGK